MIPKFRAYLKETETLAEVIHISFENKVLKVRHWEYGESTWLDFNQVELLQFTDLHDKNGKEIYEGDILFDDHHDEYGRVIFEEGRFSVEWETTTDDLFENCDVLEMLGNIYENPDLLEGTDT